MRFQPIIENVQKFVLDRPLQKAKSPLISRGEEKEGDVMNKKVDQAFVAEDDA